MAVGWDDGGGGESFFMWWSGVWRSWMEGLGIVVEGEGWGIVEREKEREILLCIRK
jgi:hypothetical protein